MKTKLFFLFALGYLLFIYGCSSKYREGIYGNNVHPKDYLELKSDGSFYLKEQGNGYSGTYKIEEGEITLILGNGNASRARINDDVITDEDGEKWILWKEGNTGLAYEEAHKSLQDKINDLEDLVRHGKLTQYDADKKIEELQKQEHQKNN